MNIKDWNGNVKSVFICNGASNPLKERQIYDYYATEGKAIYKLCAVEKFTPIVWECACGGGHLVEALKENGYIVSASDIVDRGCPNTLILDFLRESKNCDCDIITNPPYKYAKDFVEKSIEIVQNGRKVAMFLKLTFLESKSRKELFEKYPPKKIWVFSERIQCAKNGDFEGMKQGGGSAVAYAWFIWEKGFKRRNNSWLDLKHHRKIMLFTECYYGIRYLLRF